MLLLKSLFHLLEFILFYIINRKSVIPKIALIWQENQRYKRYFREKNIKLPFSLHEKWFIRSMFISNPKARKYFTLVTPETVLYRWKKAIKDYWTFDKTKPRKKGRPPITKTLKLLIRDMKIDNYLWGCKRIQDELRKISIDISRETIRKVIQDYRKSGEIKPNYSWSRFLKDHWQSLFACDFFTVDIFGFKRFYVFFIIELKSRKIIHYNVTRNPNISFLRNQFSYFEEMYPKSYLIHDNSGELKYFPYHEYEINGVATTPYSPNLNAYAERFIRSVRQECLDWFIIFSERQLRNIMKSYMEYYNKFRPHQGINSIPEGKPPDISGKIKKEPILYGLHNNYYLAS
jgi:transposase InsO family protein